MNEAIFQTKFSKFLHYHGLTGAFELKISKNPTISFSVVKEHQLNALLCVKHYTFHHKLPDVGLSQKPFDCFCLKQQPAYVVIMFYKPGVNHFYMIDIDEFIKFKKISSNKSLHEVEANRIGFKCFFGDEKKNE